MGRIALQAQLENHQFHYFMVVDGERKEITHEEMEDLYHAKQVYFAAVYGGIHG